MGGQRNKVGGQKNKVGGQKNKVVGQKNKGGVKKTRWGVKKTRCPFIAVLYPFRNLNTPTLLQVLDFVDQQHGGSPRRATFHVGVPQSAHRSWENPPGFHRKWRTYNCWIFMDFPYMEVSQNGGTPKPGGSILRLSKTWMIWATPISGNPHIYVD